MDGSTIKLLREYFKKCPMLKKGKLGVDYLGDKATSYSIDPLMTDPVIKKYTDGGSLRQYKFAFTSVEIYSSETIDNMESSTFYEDFAQWIEEQNGANELPRIEGIQSIEAITSGYLFDANTEVARYQIQCRITYYKEAK